MIVETDILRAEVHPEHGARMSSLVDKRTGRDWLVPGAPPARPEDDADYAPHAAGWDECWPSVAPCTHPDWGMMRDHGTLWGRPWRTEGDALVYEDETVRFARRLTAEGARLHADYEVSGREGTPWMWSQHVLLALRPGETFAFSGVDHPSVPPVQGVEAGVAEKTYAVATGPARAAVGGPDGAIVVSWDGAEMPAFGLWRAYGGWPEKGSSAHHTALEPTTHSADHLAAVAAPRVLSAEPARWRVTLHLLEGPPA